MYGAIAATLTQQNIYGGAAAEQTAPNTAATSGATTTGPMGTQSPVATFVVIVLLLVGLRILWEMS